MPLHAPSPAPICHPLGGMQLICPLFIECRLHVHIGSPYSFPALDSAAYLVLSLEVEGQHHLAVCLLNPLYTYQREREPLFSLPSFQTTLND